MDTIENITNLLPARPIIFQKEKRHVSVHHKDILKEERASKNARATMGHAHTPLDPPKDFLKSRNRDNIYHTVRRKNKDKASCVEPRGCDRRPNLPSAIRYPPSHRDNDGVNWKMVNVSHVKGSSAQHPVPRYVDVPEGDTQDLIPSGMFPRYVFKKNFGRVPPYLRRRQAELQLEQEIEQTQDDLITSRSLARARGLPPELEDEHDFSMLSEEEKADILKGLNANLKDNQRKLQTLPVVCETNATRKRRDELEQVVSDLGRYIFLLENYKVAVRE